MNHFPIDTAVKAILTVALPPFLGSVWQRHGWIVRELWMILTGSYPISDATLERQRPRPR